MLHLWMGCCAHHDHSARIADCHALIAACAHPCGNHEQEPHDGPCQPVNSDSSPSSPSCDASECVFLKASPLEIAGLAISELLPLPVSDLPLTALAATGFVETSAPPAPGVRLHLAHQVFLN
jgi:hypothetical protein